MLILVEQSIWLQKFTHLFISKCIIKIDKDNVFFSGKTN